MKIPNINDAQNSHLRNSLIIFLTVLSGAGLFSYITPSFSVMKSILLFIAIIIILLSFYIILSGLAFRPYHHLSRKRKSIVYCFYLVCTFSLLLSIQGSRFANQSDSMYEWIFLSISSFVTLFFVILTFSWLVFSLMAKKEFKETKKLKIVLYALPCIIVYSLYLLAFYPGAMTSDSLEQWSQTLSHNFNDWHPVAHTWFLMMITYFWKTPAAFAITQIVILSITIGYMGYTFEKSGVNKYIIYFVILFMAIIPVNGIMSITLWKDVLYSALLCLFSLYLFNMIKSKGVWIHSKTNGVLFILSSLGLTLFRHNGFYVFLLTIIVLGFVYRKTFLRFYIHSAVVIVLYLIITGPLYSFYNVTPSDPNEALAIPTQQIASVIAHDGDMTQEQLDFFNNILPIEAWKVNYNPYSVNPLKFNEKFNRAFIEENKALFFKNWFLVAWNNPKIIMKSYLKQTSVLWQIKQFDDGFSYMFTIGIDPKEMGEQLGISQTVINSSLTKYFSDVLSKTLVYPLLIFWRPAIYLFLILLSTFFIIVQGEWKKSLVMLPIFANTGMLLVAIPAQDFRYSYANLLVMGIALLTALTKRSIEGRESNYVKGLIADK